MAGMGFAEIEVFVSDTASISGATDVTDYILDTRKIVIRVGMQDWASRAPASKCDIAFLNEDRDGDGTDDLAPQRGILKEGRFLIVRVRGTHIRFCGRIRSVTRTWDETWSVKKVTVVAAGPTHPSTKSATASPLVRALFTPGSDAYPHSFWPMEGDGDVPVGHALTSDAPAMIRGPVRYGQIQVPGGGSVPMMGDGKMDELGGGYTFGSATFNVSPYTPVGGRHSVAIVYGFGPNATGSHHPIRIYLKGSAGSIGFLGYSGDTPTEYTLPNGQTAINTYPPALPFIMLYRVIFTQSGPDISVWTRSAIVMGEATVADASSTTTIPNTTMTRIDKIVLEGSDHGGGYVHVSSAPTSSTAWDVLKHNQDGWLGWGEPGDYPQVYERAETRIERTAAAEGADFRIRGSGDESEWLGRQPSANLADITEDAARADGGIVCDDWRQYGLYFAPRAWMETQDRTSPLTWSIAGGDVTVPPEYTSDDRGSSRNWVIKNESGGAAHYAADGSTGSAQQETMNLLGNPQLLPAAEWKAHTGSSTTQRIPSCRMRFEFTPDLEADWLDAQPGDVVRLTGLPSEIGYGIKGGYAEAGRNYTLMGWVEEYDFHTYSAVPFLQPDDVVEVGLVGSMSVGHLHNTLSSTMTTSSTSFTVTTNGSSHPATPPNQVHSPGVPIVIDQTGEEMLVTQTANSGSTCTFTVQRGINGVALPVPSGSTFHVVASSALARGDNV